MSAFLFRMTPGTSLKGWHCMKTDPTGNKKLTLNRRSIRLKGYDYSQAGAYFVTICTQNRLHLFGEITNDEIVLNEAGMMVEKWWNELKNKYPDIELDEFVVMPNHFHGILQIFDTNTVGADLRVCPDNVGEHKEKGKHKEEGKHIGLPLQRMMQWFKTMSTNEYIRNVKNNHWTPFIKKLWQRNYYDHIVRNENELNRIREYIIINPMQWQCDRENPNHILGDDNNTKWNQIEEMIYGK
jgi:REP element-mobilizing transposase RayT